MSWKAGIAGRLFLTGIELKTDGRSDLETDGRRDLKIKLFNRKTTKQHNRITDKYIT